MMPTTIHPPIALPFDALRQALADYEKSVDDVNADELSAEEKALAESVRVLLAHVDSTDPTAIAWNVLDNHAIRPHWRRSGEQLLPLIAEGIALVTGAQVAVQPTSAAPIIADADPVLIRAVYDALPDEAEDNPMPFVEVALRVSRSHGYSDAETRAALLALENANRAGIQYGRGWYRREAE